MPKEPSHLKTGSTSLNCMIINARSLVNKIDNVIDAFVTKDVNIGFVSETWLTSKNNLTTSVLKCSHYNIAHVFRSNRRGGGVGVILKDDLAFRSTSDACFKIKFLTFEYIVIQLLDQFKTFLLCVYRPPSDYNLAPFLTEFSSLLQSLTIYPNPFVICGDFNIPLNNHQNVSRTIPFLDLLTEFNVMNGTPSVSTHTGGNTLDLLLYSNTLINRISSPYVDHDIALSDHFPVLFAFDTALKVKQWKTHCDRRDYKSVDKSLFLEDLVCALEKNYNFSSDSFASCLDNFNTSLSNCIDKHAPIQRSKIKYKVRPPWIDHEFVLERAKRRRLEKLFKKSRSQLDKCMYVSQSNYCNRLIKEKRHLYYEKTIEICDGDQKSLFNFVNHLLDKDGGTKDCLPVITDSNSDVRSDLDLAADFNNYFIEKINTIRKGFPQSQSSQSADTGKQIIASNTTTSFDSFAPCTNQEVMELLQVGSCKTYPLLDTIPAFLLSYCKNELITYLTHLVNISLSTGNINNLKEAYVRPTIKNTTCNADLLQNYRPISNLSFISKLVERAVLSRLNEHLSMNGFINHHQFGYKKNHSCESLLLTLANDILENMEQKKYTVVVMCDLSAAFDTVDHQILLSLLNDKFSISGIALKWFDSFLSGRSQRVIIRNSESPSHSVSCGVPQGSVLGPVLFNMYTNSLSEVFSSCDFKSLNYADDTTGYFAFPLESQTLINDAVDKCLKNVKTWMDGHYLKLNKDKTQIIIFSSPTIYHHISIDAISLSNENSGMESIKLNDQVKYLGVYLDTHFSLVSHINRVCSSCYFHLKQISSIRSFIGQSHCESLVHASVTSRIDYCNSLYFGLPKYLVLKLQRVQNAAARLVLLKCKYDHISLCIYGLHWLNVEKRIAYKILILTYKLLHNSAPVLLANTLSLTPLSSRSTLTLSIKFHCSKYGRRSFSYCAPRLWNCLPQSLRAVNNLPLFKTHLKTYLFSSYDLLIQKYCHYAKLLP